MPSRRLVALVVLALAVVVGPLSVLLVAPASAKAPKTVYTSAPKASVARPIINETFTISGSFGHGPPRVAALQRKVGSTWKIVTRKAIGKSGGYAFAVKQPDTTVQWRVATKAVKYKGTTRKRRESRVLTVTRQAQTAAVTAPDGVNVGATVTAKVTAAPLRPGRALTLQIDRGLGWQTVATTRTSSTGQAVFPPQTVLTVGSIRFRAVLAASGGAAQHVGATRTTYVMPARRMRVAAHRGYSTVHPENTLVAYRAALDGDTDWLETDFQRTAPDTEADLANPACAPFTTGAPEEHWIALHDADFLRTTDVLTVFPPATNPTKYVNGKPLVKMFTVCEIKRLDAGGFKGAAGLPVPTLTETLDLVTASANTDANLLVEPKLGTADEAIDLVDAIRAYDDEHADQPGYRRFLPYGLGARSDRATFNTFSLAVAEALNDQRPAVEVAFIADTDAETDPAVAPFADAVFVRDNLVTKARIDALHAVGKSVFVWTVTKEARWFELASLGADVVVTGNSTRARKVLTGTE